MIRLLASALLAVGLTASTFVSTEAQEQMGKIVLDWS